MAEAIERVTDGVRGLTQRVRDLESTVLDRLDSQEGGTKGTGELAEEVEDRVAARLEDAMLSLREEMRALAEETPTGPRTSAQREI
jgi:hypothetical protein